MWTKEGEDDEERVRKGKTTILPKIDCERHGKSCRHLCDEQGLSYFAIRPWPKAPFVQAWCEKCHAVLEEEGGCPPAGWQRGAE